MIIVLEDELVWVENYENSIWICKCCYDIRYFLKLFDEYFINIGLGII